MMLRLKQFVSRNLHFEVSAKSIVIMVVIILLLATNALTLKLYLDTFHVDEETQIDETGDELSRAKFFIKDWYDELSQSYGEPKIYYNELQFCGGTYTITVAQDRIRAIYPRGTRTFQLDYVSYIEFYKENKNLYCRLYFDGEGGEYRFLLDSF